MTLFVFAANAFLGKGYFPSFLFAVALGATLFLFIPSRSVLVVQKLEPDTLVFCAPLAEAEEWNADLLVLGSSARSWLSATFFETTMLHVVRHVGRPIFVGS